MAHGYENLIPFNKRSEEEQRRIRSAGGRASGKVRRRKADFRKMLNALLTIEINSEEWTPFLKANGIDSTLEAAVNAAMIREALNGNVKAYMAIKDVLGQTSRSEADLEEQKLRMNAAKAKMGVVDEETPDDGFMEALRETAATDWKEFKEPGEDECDEEQQESRV